MVAERKLTDQELTLVAETLIGTADDIETGLAVVLGDGNAGLDDMSLPDCQHFDTLTFLCADCGWWHALEDLGESEDDLRCKECLSWA